MCKYLVQFGFASLFFGKLKPNYFWFGSVLWAWSILGVNEG